MTPVQEQGIKTLHAELKRADRLMAEALNVLAGADDIAYTLKLDVPMLQNVELLRAMQAVTARADAIREKHYYVFYPQAQVADAMLTLAKRVKRETETLGVLG